MDRTQGHACFYTVVSGRRFGEITEVLQEIQVTIAGFLIYLARKGRATNCSIVRTRKTLRLWAISIQLKDYIGNFDRFDREYKRRAQYTRLG
jgi:hypothetical protein